MVLAWENEEQAKAARRLIIVTEELVPPSTFNGSRSGPSSPAIAWRRWSINLLALIPQRFSDVTTTTAEHLKLYAEQHKTPEKMDEYLQKYVLGTRDHWEYLEKVGGLRRMNEIKAEAIFGY